MVDTSGNKLFNSNKFYAKYYEPLAELFDVGRKFDDCDCVVFSKQDKEITIELCEKHVRDSSDRSWKYIGPTPKPAYAELKTLD